MAGIGWRLERLMERDSLGSTVSAFLTGVAVTSGPWLLTTMVLVAMRLSAVETRFPGIDSIEQVITIVYAIVIVTSAPIDIVLSRYASDRVYEGRRDAIAAPLRRTVAACLVGFLAIGALSMRVIDVPLEMAVPGAVLAAIVGAQWLLLSAAGGLSSPGIILKAFGIGAPISVIAAATLCREDAVGGLGYLYGYGIGQLVTLGLLVHGTFRALPDHDDEEASATASFREYWLLAAAALAFNAGLWIDKLIVYLVSGADVASAYSAAAAVAWLSVVPACAFLFVNIETVFHRKFRAYYLSLHAGASLAELEELAVELREQVGKTLRGTAAVQACVTLVCLPAAPAIARQLALGEGTTLQLLLVGAGFQVLAVSTTLLLYYFDFRREAFLAALTQLLANSLLTVVFAEPTPLLGAGYALACAATLGIAVVLLFRRMGDLLQRTFQLQPYASEEAA